MRVLLLKINDAEGRARAQVEIDPPRSISGYDQDAIGLDSSSIPPRLIRAGNQEGQGINPWEE